MNLIPKFKPGDEVFIANKDSKGGTIKKDDEIIKRNNKYILNATGVPRVYLKPESAKEVINDSRR